MGLEDLIVLIVVFASFFASLFAVVLSKEQSVWAVWGCIYCAVVSIAWATIKISFLIVLGGDVDWHEVLLVVMLFCAFGVSVVSVMLGARR